MRSLANRDRIESFMDSLRLDEETRMYFTGGATAVLYGWRESTIDVDVKLVPERDSALHVVQEVKERLQINVELASPVDFIPVSESWESRSPFIRQVGRTFFHHFDLYAQALAKVERGHRQDTEDVRAMLRTGLVDTKHLLSYFEDIEPRLYRYPAIDPAAFREKVIAYGRGS